MITYNRICIKDYDIVDSEGTHFKLIRGKEYITSKKLENKEVTVFSTYWVRVPIDIFAGEVKFT